MADADEDAISLPSSSKDATGNIDLDLSDETQDFRFLSNVSSLSDPSQQASIPRRGEKDFEPNPTLHQSDALASSRNAMHNALALPRLHNPKTRIVGIYCPEGTLRLASRSQTSESSALPSVDEQAYPSPSAAAAIKEAETTGIGVGKGTCVCVPLSRGQHFRTTGQADRFNRTWLLPEEALYLIERGSLDIRWPNAEDSLDLEGGGESIPMSLQAAYACFIGRGGLTLERYTVYAGLKRSGYTVVRADSWDETFHQEEQSEAQSISGQEVARGDNSGLVGFLVRLFKSICSSGSTCSTAMGPVIGLGLHRSYNDIYRALSLTSNHTSSASSKSLPPPTTPPFRLAYNVYKPSTTFRKSSPPTPDFRLAIINARTQTTLPTLSQLSALLESTPPDPPRGERMDRLLYLRLRHGHRNVILAVVDQGVVSFIRVGDARFGGERIYKEMSGGGGSKRGGGARGGGRGGRGRGGRGGSGGRGRGR